MEKQEKFEKEWEEFIHNELPERTSKYDIARMFFELGCGFGK